MGLLYVEERAKNLELAIPNSGHERLHFGFPNTLMLADAMEERRALCVTRCSNCRGCLMFASTAATRSSEVRTRPSGRGGVDERPSCPQRRIRGRDRRARRASHRDRRGTVPLTEDTRGTGVSECHRRVRSGTVRWSDTPELFAATSGQPGVRRSGEEFAALASPVDCGPDRTLCPSQPRRGCDRSSR